MEPTSEQMHQYLDLCDVSVEGYLKAYRARGGHPVNMEYWDSTLKMAESSPTAATAVIMCLLHQAALYSEQ